MTRRQLALYLAWEYGTRGALRILRGSKPFGDSETLAENSWFERCGPWYLLPVQSIYRTRRQTKKNATDFMHHVETAICHMEGRLRAPMCGGAGVMRVVKSDFNPN